MQSHADRIFHGLVEGRVSKQLKEICLLDQVYVKAEDGKQTVAKLILHRLLRKLVLTSSSRASFVLRQAKVLRRRLMTSQQKLQHRQVCKIYQLIYQTE